MADKPVNFYSRSLMAYGTDYTPWCLLYNKYEESSGKVINTIITIPTTNGDITVGSLDSITQGVSGKFGNAIKGSAVTGSLKTGYISTENVLNCSSTKIVTIVGWVRFDSNGSNLTIRLADTLTNVTFYLAIQEASGGFSTAIITDTHFYQVNWTSMVHDDTWRHFAVVIDNSQVQGRIVVYIDGESVSTTLATNSKSGNNVFSSVQKLYTYFLIQSTGNLYSDDMAVFGLELTQAQVKEIMAHSVDGSVLAPTTDVPLDFFSRSVGSVDTPINFYSRTV